MPTADALMDFGQIYSGDYCMHEGRSIWKFVIVTYQGQTYVVEKYPSDNPVVKRLL